MTRRKVALCLFLFLVGLMGVACTVPGSQPVPQPTVPPLLPDITPPAPSATGTLPPQRLPTPARAALARVRHVIDGDTVVLDNGEHVRYIGINTPGIDRYYYEEAREFNRSLVEGREVRLEYDVERRDHYQRLLAYVWLDDAMVNLELARNGFANAMTVPPNVRYEALFRDAEQTARKAGRGLWARAAVPLRIMGMEPDPPGPDEDNLNGEWIEIENQGKAPVQMRGYSLADAGNSKSTFPNFTLAPGRRVRLLTGSGKNSPFVLYWGSPTPIWGNGGDGAYLRTPQGVLVDSFEY